MICRADEISISSKIAFQLRLEEKQPPRQADEQLRFLQDEEYLYRTSEDAKPLVLQVKMASTSYFFQERAILVLITDTTAKEELQKKEISD